MAAAGAPTAPAVGWGGWAGGAAGAPHRVAFISLIRALLGQEGRRVRVDKVAEGRQAAGSRRELPCKAAPAAPAEPPPSAYRCVAALRLLLLALGTASGCCSRGCVVLGLLLLLPRRRGSGHRCRRLRSRAALCQRLLLHCCQMRRQLLLLYHALQLVMHLLLMLKLHQAGVSSWQHLWRGRSRSRRHRSNGGPHVGGPLIRAQGELGGPALRLL